MIEIKGLIGAAQMITTKMGLLTNETTTDEAKLKELDLLSRELICLCETLKNVAYEKRHQEKIPC